MTAFYDDPYCLIDEAFEAVNNEEYSQAQAHALIAIAIVLLGFLDEPADEGGVPAAPIMYEDFPGD